MSQEEKQALRPEGRRPGRQDEGASPASTPRCSSSTSGSTSPRSEGSYIEQETWTTTPQFTVTARKDGETRTRSVHRRADDRRLGSRRSVGDGRERRAHRRRGGRVLHRQAGRHGRQGPDPHAVARDAHDPRDRRARDRARSHPRLRGQLRRHQLREADRRRQAEIRLEAVQRHRRPDHPRRRGDDRLRRRRREDAAVARSCAKGSWSGCRPTARSAALIGEKASRGCTSANSWRDYPFLRMPNVHVEPGPAGIADAGGDHRRHQGRRAHRRPRQLLDRPAALQRPVRRQRVLGRSRTARRRAW